MTPVCRCWQRVKQSRLNHCVRSWLRSGIRASRSVAGERTSGVCGVSAPIFNHQQKVVGAISVSGPMPRFDMEKALQYSTLIMEKAKKISSILGARV